MTVAAIHQPNFFPWLGYFAKIRKCDVFVFLDLVQYPRSSRGTWVNRVGVLRNGTKGWLSCPLSKSSTSGYVADVLPSQDTWQESTLATLSGLYGKHPHFGEISPFLETLFSDNFSGLARFNEACIVKLSDLFGLECRFVRQSDLKGSACLEARGSERLAAICKEVAADTYLAGDGADAYEDIEAYERQGVGFERNRFSPVRYPQPGNGDFVSGLSVLDALFSIGVRETAQMLKDM